MFSIGAVELDVVLNDTMLWLERMTSGVLLLRTVQPSGTARHVNRLRNCRESFQFLFSANHPSVVYRAFHVRSETSFCMAQDSARTPDIQTVLHIPCSYSAQLTLFFRMPTLLLHMSQNIASWYCVQPLALFALLPLHAFTYAAMGLENMLLNCHGGHYE